MSAENKAIIRRLFDEVVNGGDLATIDELFAPTYFRQDPDSPGLPPGPEVFKQLITTYRTAFPDLHVTVDDLIDAEDDRVVVRWTARGTHQGEFLGMVPTGRPVVFTGISIYPLVGGKIAEDWVNRDTHGLKEQFVGMQRRQRAAG